MKLCVFPNDPLLSYYEKGEIKLRYFNPKNFFDEIHVLSTFESDVDEEKVKIVAGSASLKIHNVGKVNLFNYRRFEKRINDLIEQINPNIIRSYNPLLQGWLATKASKKLNIPLVISIHTNYEQQRKIERDKRNFFKFMKLKYILPRIEKFVISNADAIVCVYEFIIPYAKKMGAKNVHLIYNKVDTQRFSNQVKKKFLSTKPTIISVGRLIDQKNHSYLIQAMKDLDAKLLLIGDGPNFESLNKMIHTLDIEDKVEMIKRVPNDELPQYYASCDVYVQPMENLGGIPIPVLEAMACGLPVVMSKHSNDYSEIIDEAVVFAENSPSSFLNAFNQILFNPEYKEKLKRKSLSIISKIGGEKMEEEELLLYRKLIDKTKIS
ncbi:MAG: glycosyltransferase family 4 protein [Thermodesulfobacteriota bacterium]